MHLERAAQAVRLARQIELFEVLAGFHQGADHLKSGSRVHVVVQLAIDQEQLAFQQVSIVHIRRGTV